MKQMKKKFLLIDDDSINNYLSIMILENTFQELLVYDFTIPENGLEFIKSELNLSPLNGKTTLFLDINMPTMSGWEFLEEFELLDASIKEQYNIYILSSSLNPKDIDRADANPLVKGFIEKPLNEATLLKIFE